MSQFSGKCDFYDGFVMIRSDSTEEKLIENLKGLKLYIHGKDGRDHRVKSDTLKDIVKYYPYIEIIMAGDKDKVTIILSSDSFIDSEEKEMLGYKIETALKYWRKCKRNKVSFNKDECSTLFWHIDNVEKEIINRVAEKGDKAEFEGIHLSMHEYYRKKWFDEMVKAGYTEFEAYNWCFKGLFDDEDTVIKRLGRPLKVEKL